MVNRFEQYIIKIIEYPSTRNDRPYQSNNKLEIIYSVVIHLF